MTDYVLTYRDVKGSVLTASEFDANTHNLDDRTTALETTAAGLSSVVSAEVDTSGHLILVLSNDDTIDAGDLSRFMPSFTDLFIGPWPASTQLYENQIFSANGSLYVVLRDHVSSTTFARGANDGAGHDYYQAILDYTSISGVEISDTTFTPDETHVGLYIRLTTTDTAGCVVTIDPAVDWPDWAELHFRDETVAGASFEIITSTATPAVINPQYNCDTISAGTGSTIALKKVGATDDWDIWGHLALTVTA